MWIQPKRCQLEGECVRYDGTVVLKHNLPGAGHDGRLKKSLKIWIT